MLLFTLFYSFHNHRCGLSFLVYCLLVIYCFCLLCHLALMAMAGCSHPEQRKSYAKMSMTWFKPFVYSFYCLVYMQRLRRHVIYFLSLAFTLSKQYNNGSSHSICYVSNRHRLRSNDDDVHNDYNLMHKLSPVQSHTHIRKCTEKLWIPSWILITSRRNRNARPFRLNYFT